MNSKISPLTSGNSKNPNAQGGKIAVHENSQTTPADPNSQHSEIISSAKKAKIRQRPNSDKKPHSSGDLLKPRSVSFSDLQWEEIGARATAAGRDRAVWLRELLFGGSFRATSRPSENRELQLLAYIAGVLIRISERTAHNGEILADDLLESFTELIRHRIADLLGHDE